MVDKTHHSDENEILQHILDKLNKAETKPEDVTIFGKDEVASIRRMMLTEEEAVTLRSLIEFATGFKTAGKFFNWFKKVAIYIGWFVFGYMSLKGYFMEFLKSVKP